MTVTYDSFSQFLLSHNGMFYEVMTYPARARLEESQKSNDHFSREKKNTKQMENPSYKKNNFKVVR